ncbi:MAG: NAD(P)-dependent oxidoreductase, partial [bacterium]
MRIALIGAGYVGGAVLKEAVQRGHDVTVIVRHPEKIEAGPLAHPRAGDVFEIENLADLLKGHDAVISAYNPGAAHPQARDLQLKGTLATLSAAQKSGVKRFLVVGGAGSLEIAPGKQLVDSPDFPKDWREGAMGLRDALTEIRKEKDLEWSFFSPAILLVPGERTGRYRLGLD